MHLNIKEVDRIIETALEEDIGRGDITSQLTIPEDAVTKYSIRAREPMVVCGINVVTRVFDRLSMVMEQEVHFKNGDYVEAGAELVVGRGRVREIFAAERVALNLFQHMSGVATTTRQYVEAVKGTNAKILDTRKTLPGLREIQKFAVRVGGGFNHRYRLDDGILIKDNHISICGGIAEALKRAKGGALQGISHPRIEIECDTLDQVKEAIAHEADIIMLDNMDLDTMREAVKLSGGRVPLEASGNVNLQTVGDIAKTGVDFISVGRLTHSVRSIDIALDIDA